MPLATVPTDLTLPAAFARAAEGAGKGTGISVIGAQTEEHHSYPELLEMGRHRAAGLAERGIGRGDPVCLFAHTTFDFITCLLGLWNLGAIPVPLPFPPRLATKRTWLEGSRNRITQAGAKLLLLADGDPDPQSVPALPITSLAGSDAPVDDGGSTSDDVALYQFSSGSTGHPSGVVLTHRALTAQLDLNTRMHVQQGSERSLAWLPMYHDLGLITHLLAPMANGMDNVVMPTTLFLKDPLQWLVEISKRRANVSSAPSFGFGLAARALDRSDADLDLSSWSQAYCGGEPVDPNTMERFIRVAGRHGFDKGAMLPGYGLAEATCVVTARMPGQGVLVDRVDRDELSNGSAVAADARTSRPTEFVSVGAAMHGVDVAISDDKGTPLADRVVGEILVRSESMMEAYLNDLEATARVFRDGWLRTGDLGYLVDGQVFVTGRLKDVIIVAGQNHHAEDIERLVLKIEGLRPGGCICIQTVEEGNALVVLAEAADGTSGERLGEMRDEIARLVSFEIGLTAGDIVLLPRGSVPKTSSGKLQRRLAKRMYEEGRFTSLLTR